jgi:hypothetical protein
MAYQERLLRDDGCWTTDPDGQAGALEVEVRIFVRLADAERWLKRQMSEWEPEIPSAPTAASSIVKPYGHLESGSFEPWDRYRGEPLWNPDGEVDEFL